MALELKGELLAVRTQHISGGTNAKGKSYDAFDRVTMTVFDAGRTYDVDVARDFPLHRKSELQGHLDGGVRPIVTLDVYAGRYGLTATDAVSIDVPKQSSLTVAK